MTKPSPTEVLVAHYESCFLEHGRTPQGVDWPDAAGLATRFDVMLGVLRPEPARPSVLDLGCGPGLLLDHLQAQGRLDSVGYQGVELSEPMLEAARRAWPEHAFSRRDLLADPLPAQSVDYVILNGVLTERRSVAREEMAGYAVDLLAACFETARVGVAFNVMSKLVDWERDDLFHWGFDEMAAAVAKRLSRHIQVRADYGLYEYTVYVYHQASA